MDEKSAAQRSSTDEAGAVPVPAPTELKPPLRPFLAPISVLTDEQASAPGVRAFLIDEIERSEARCAELKPYVEKYHDLRVENAELHQKLKGSKLNDALSAICLAAGSAAIAASSRFFSVDAITGYVVLAVAVALLVGGIVAKVVK